MNKQQEQVLEFHKAFNLPAPTKPEWDPRDVVFRFKLISEEMAESHEALYEAALEGNPIPLIDLLCDLNYFIDGTAVAMGVDLEPFFDEIHRANMDKLDKCLTCEGTGISHERHDWDVEILSCQDCQGKGKVPIYREDGKVKKPENWVEQDLYKVWYEQYAQHIIAKVDHGTATA